MRSSLITAYLLTVGMYAPAANVLQQFPPAPPQAQTVPPQRQPQTELERQRSVTADAVARTGAESQGGPATHTPAPQPGRSQHSGDRQLPGPVGLLLAVALLDGQGAAPHENP